MRMAMLDGAALETGDHWFESNPFPDQIPVGPGRGPFQIEAGPGGNPPCTISETDARDIAKSIHCLLPRFKEAIDAFNDYKDYGPLFAGNPQCKMTSKTPPPDIPTHPELAYAAMACLAERPQNPYGPHQIQHAWDLASSVSSPQSVPAPLAGAPPQSLPAPSAWQIPGLLVVLVATTLIVRRRLPS
jgi:hypothetical protein